MPSASVGDVVSLLLLEERARDRKPVPPQDSRWFQIIVCLLLDRQPFRANDLYLPQEPSNIQLAPKPQYRTYITYSISSSFPFVKVFEVLSATSPPNHLIVVSTSCLFSSSSNFLLYCFPLISPYTVLSPQHWPPSSHSAFLT